MSEQIKVGNIDRDYSEIAREDPLSIYMIVNGSLEMGSGKIAAQAYQLAMWIFSKPDLSDSQRAALAAWRDEGARVIVRTAKTESMWERILREIPGVILSDEGLTEVEWGADTCFCTWPLRRSEAPKLLGNKKVPLLS